MLNYIVDFYCPAIKLVIELDGRYHDNSDQVVEDQMRQKHIEALGVNFLRFGEIEVKKDRESVIGAIEDYIEAFELKTNLNH